VDGGVVKGPTGLFCAFAGIDPDAAGVARAYEGLIDGVVADEPVDGLPALVTATLMHDPESRRGLAQRVLDFGRSLG
jgi:LPPG:FO 2-phospho-L-lactate transferase